MINQVLHSIEWSEIANVLGHLLAAFVLALPMGWNREKRSQGAGLRTFPLVAMASCGFMLIGIDEYQSAEAQARLAYGIITGIGFIGGGAILKNDHKVSGTATASCIWSTGAIGLSVAHNRFEIAIALSIANVFTLLVGGLIKGKKKDT